MNIPVKPAISYQESTRVADQFEDKINVSFVEGAATRIGYLANIKQISLKDDKTEIENAAVLLYFIQPD
jgi:hypothetical protein